MSRGGHSFALLAVLRVEVWLPRELRCVLLAAFISLLLFSWSWVFGDWFPGLVYCVCLPFPGGIASGRSYFCAQWLLCAGSGEEKTSSGLEWPQPLLGCCWSEKLNAVRAPNGTNWCETSSLFSALSGL